MSKLTCTMRRSGFRPCFAVARRVSLRDNARHAVAFVEGARFERARDEGIKPSPKATSVVWPRGLPRVVTFCLRCCLLLFAAVCCCSLL
eukprot:5177098-Pleurochrysis_carterae.AAC.1